jgi:hypothetical protein
MFKHAAKVPLDTLRKWVWTLPTEDITPRQLEQYVSSDKLGKVLSSKRRRKQIFKAAERAADRNSSRWRNTDRGLTNRYGYFRYGIDGAPDFLRNPKVREVLRKYGIADMELFSRHTGGSGITTSWRTKAPLNPTTAHLITRSDLRVIPDEFEFELGDFPSYPEIAHELGHAVTYLEDNRALMRNELSGYLAKQYDRLDAHISPIRRWLINREYNYGEHLANINGKRVMDSIKAQYPETASSIDAMMRNHRPARAHHFYTYLHNSINNGGYNFPLLSQALSQLQGSTWMDSLVRSMANNTGKSPEVITRYLSQVFGKLRQLR